jgi:hypothetical protein
MTQRRNRAKHITSFEDRLSAEALSLMEQAKTLQPGLRRDHLLRKARETETASHISEWLSSPGLQPPR